MKVSWSPELSWRLEDLEQLSPETCLANNYKSANDNEFYDPQKLLSELLEEK